MRNELGCALLALARLQEPSLPEARLGLPAPSGPNPVGTTVSYLVDDSRKDASFEAGRPITLQLWYPATAAAAEQPLAPYLVEDGLVRALAEQGYYEVEPERLAAWGALVTHARRDAAPAPGRHPLVTFSVGLGVVRANYTTFAEELASHGLVFALVESPLAGLMLRPDGTVVQDTSARLESAEGHRAAVDEWAADVRFALDRLADGKGAASLAPVAATLDWSRVGALGHSSGGLVALQCSADDERVRTALDLDGGLVTPADEPLARCLAAEGGLAEPALVLRSKPLYGEADLARRGLTREQWEQRGAAGKAALDALVTRSAGRLVVAGVAGTGHFSFSDAPFVMPSAITRFGGRIIDARRGWLVITGAIRAFLDDHLGEPRSPEAGTAFAAARERFPELELQAQAEAPR